MGDTFTMASARRRFAVERLSGTEHGMSFRAWARKTYNPRHCEGKLRRLVEPRR
jgi:hypothetical protein